MRPTPYAYPSRRRISAASAKVTLLAILAAVAFAVAFVCFTFMATTGSADGIDEPVHRWVLGRRFGWETFLLKAATNLGSSLLLWPVVGASAIFLIWRARRWRSAILPVLSLAGVLLSKDVAKNLVARPRPPMRDWLTEASGLAYPSGHAMQAFAFFMAFAVVLSEGRAGRGRLLVHVAALFLVLVVGWSRVYLGVHWLTDVLGGFALAGAWLSLLVSAMLALRPRAERVRNEPYPPARGP